MMGPRSPIIKSGPQAISCGQREVPAAMARLANVIVPTRVPTLPSRPRTASKSSGLVVALSDPDGDPQLSQGPVPLRERRRAGCWAQLTFI